MTSVREHITLSLGVLDKVLTQDLLLVEDLHREEPVCLLRFSVACLESELFNEVDDTKGTLSKLHHGFKVLGANKVLSLLVLSLQLLVKLPNLDELVLPTGI